MEPEIQQCDICLEFVNSTLETFELRNCSHRFCQSCLVLFIHQKLSTGLSHLIPCPSIYCEQFIHPDDVTQLLQVNPTGLSQYQSLEIRYALQFNPEARFCPGTRCTYVALVSKRLQRQRSELQCPLPNCNTVFCSGCGTESHGGSCKIRRFQVMGPNVKRCPNCRIYCTKEGGCNFVLCALCGTQFCWFCGQDTDGSCFMHWAAFCSLRTDRITKRLINLKLSGWSKLAAKFVLLLAFLILLPALVTCSILFALPWHICSDGYQSLHNRNIFHRIFLVSLMIMLFYPLYLMFSPILWIVLFVDCIFDLITFALDLQ